MKGSSSRSARRWLTNGVLARAQARIWPSASRRSGHGNELPGGSPMVMTETADGRVVQIIGTVLDIEFPPDRLPAINSAVNVIREDGTPLVTEVQQHLGNNWVRCLAMDSTDGLRRYSVAVDTGAAIQVPVGEKSLGRMFNVLGLPIDNLPAVTDGPMWGIHRDPPPFAEQETAPSVLET